jgi:hypothetical protein
MRVAARPSDDSLTAARPNLDAAIWRAYRLGRAVERAIWRRRRLASQ